MPDSFSEFDSFGALLRHLRRRARITQRELGTAVGYSEAHIARLEANQRRPDVAAITGRFIDALDLDDLPDLREQLVALASAARKTSLSSTPVDLLSEAQPTNLREQLTAFIGRDDELSEAKRLLHSTRLLTITGSGGIGKSRLAAQIASELLPGYSDGVWIVSFANVTSPDDVVTAVAGTMNLASLDLMDGLKQYLKNRKALLILDNCEHVVTACARLAVTILQVCAHLQIIATSREAFSVPGEVAWTLPPMTCDETHDLFIARARAMRPDFDATPETEPLLSQICDELEGNPLAIELAAARMQVLSLQEIVDMLDDRFRLLTGGNRLAHPRHQSMRALLDWSYGLLTTPERALFVRLAAFESDWTLDDVEALYAHTQTVPKIDALDLLTQLVKKSLIMIEEHASPARYMLSRSVRQYAAERALENAAYWHGDAAQLTALPRRNARMTTHTGLSNANARAPQSPLPQSGLAQFMSRHAPGARHTLSADDVEPLTLRALLQLADIDLLEHWENATAFDDQRAGHMLLQREIKKLYARIADDDIAVMHSAESAIYTALRLLLRPGDHVIAIWPSAKSYAELARSCGAEISPLPVRPMGHRWAHSKHWMIDLNELRAAFRHNTRLLITNFPHNPSGAQPTPEEFREIAAITAQHGAHWLSDESARFLEYSAAERLPSAADLYPRAISIGGVAQAFALPGVRISWIASPLRTLIEQAVAAADQTSGGAGTPNALLAAMALRVRERVIGRSQAIVKHNLELATQFFQQHEAHIDWTPPSAGCVGFPKLKRLNADALSTLLLRDQRTLLAPASLFGYPYAHFRLGLGRRNLPDVLAHLAHALTSPAGSPIQQTTR
jgi:predicted ATPase/aspartate/methionine/tyrosine aminotransferase